MPGLVATAIRIGHYAWIERRLFEVVGGWAASTDRSDLDVKLWFAEEANRHAWHAELWHRRLPELRELDASALTTAPSKAAEAFMATLAGTIPTIDRLVGLARVGLPRLVAALDEHQGVASPIADGSVIRSIRIVRSDLVDDWAAGERLLQRQLKTARDVEHAARAQVGFEEFLTGSVAFGQFPDSS